MATTITEGDISALNDVCSTHGKSMPSLSLHIDTMLWFATCFNQAVCITSGGSSSITEAIQSLDTKLGGNKK